MAEDILMRTSLQSPGTEQLEAPGFQIVWRSDIDSFTALWGVSRASFERGFGNTHRSSNCINLSERQAVMFRNGCGSIVGTAIAWFNCGIAENLEVG